MPSNDAARLQLPAEWNARCAAVKADLDSGTPTSLGRMADELGIPFELFAWLIAQQAIRGGIPVFMNAGDAPAHQIPSQFN